MQPGQPVQYLDGGGVPAQYFGQGVAPMQFAGSAPAPPPPPPPQQPPHVQVPGAMAVHGAQQRRRAKGKPSPKGADVGQQHMQHYHAHHPSWTPPQHAAVHYCVPSPHTDHVAADGRRRMDDGQCVESVDGASIQSCGISEYPSTGGSVGFSPVPAMYQPPGYRHDPYAHISGGAECSPPHRGGSDEDWSSMVPVACMPHHHPQPAVASPMRRLVQQPSPPRPQPHQYGHAVYAGGSLSPPQAPGLPTPPPGDGKVDRVGVHPAPVAPHYSQPPVLVATVKFRVRQQQYMLPAGLRIGGGDFVVVDGDRGIDIGRVERVVEGQEQVPNQTVQRPATEDEIRLWKELAAEEQAAIGTVQPMLDKCRINICVVGAEFQFDRKKLTFYYTSKEAQPRVRQVLQDCFTQWKCRIWFEKHQGGGMRSGAAGRGAGSAAGAHRRRT
eukprot:TRINITY_DN575_c5_g1_i2.p1 TRINITY_DN575_c5_g1~~TRINITY_DN575_c5_g1_i2.p1  ORF type:complete len:440 (+),score=101.58 TRINITY_DN575_c5_g1_i2:328-1647(+)